MPASKRHMNVTAQWTPTAGVATDITGIQSVTPSHNGSIQEHSGGVDHFPTVIVNDYENPSIQISHRDLNMQYGCNVGDRGSLVYTVSDAKNKVAVGGGGFTGTLSNAIISDLGQSHAHRQFSGGTMTFNAESSDGSTSPLAFAAL